ncbi:hypothetical protein GCM10010259_14140 [Streptomyces daghestanicus]|uniref:Secreted protein n=1 Tax=Streptomyces daghestanicus TaxID=66885 RepID=A0ABQ3PXM6_9ACTN|nr:hypothetical protein GCM10010259_14140 [Streptomyces daghestanicus]GHI29765.1 hypothetical protein Sdagh_14950 [Streptomyces daghestanicus]
MLGVGLVGLVVLDAGGLVYGAGDTMPCLSALPCVKRLPVRGGCAGRAGKASRRRAVALESLSHWNSRLPRPAGVTVHRRSDSGGRAWRVGGRVQCLFLDLVAGWSGFVGVFRA